MFSSRNAHTVTLRWPHKARPPKGDCGTSFEARRKRGERLRMTLCVWLGLVSSTSVALAVDAGYFGYGKPATAAEIAGGDIEVRGDDGAGLPAGQGAAAKGAEVYAEQCAACHGTFGEGEGRFPK